MGLLNAFSGWMAANREKKLARHEAMGTCPECSGKGYYTAALSEYTYPGASLDDFQCQGCNGSGLFADWSSVRQ